MKAMEAHRRAQAAARRALAEGEAPPPAPAGPDGENGRDWDGGDQVFQRRLAQAAAMRDLRQRMAEEPGHWSSALGDPVGVTRVRVPRPWGDDG